MADIDVIASSLLAAVADINNMVSLVWGII